MKKAKQKPHRQAVINNAEHIPAGYVRLATFGHKEAAQLSFAARYGHIPSVKLIAYSGAGAARGPVYVSQTEAEGHLALLDLRHNTAAPEHEFALELQDGEPRGAFKQPFRLDAAQALDTTRAVLKRIADLLEIIANGKN